MAKVTRSGRKLKDDDDSNISKRRQVGSKAVTSGPSTTETSGLRRSTRDKQSTTSPSSTRRSERIEKNSPNTPPTTRKSERVERQKMPRHLRRSCREEKRLSLSLSGSNKSEKGSSSLEAKKEKQKKGKNEKQLKLNSKDETGNMKKSLKPVPKIKKKKTRLNARSYRVALFLKPQEGKVKESEIGEKLKLHDDLSQGDSENTGTSGSRKVEHGDCSESKGEEVGQDDLEEGCERDIEGSCSHSCKPAECISGHHTEIEVPHLNREHKDYLEEAYKTNNRDNSPVSEFGDRSLQSSLNGDVVIAKEAIEDTDKIRMDCLAREDLQKPELMGSPSEGRSPPGDCELEKTEKVGDKRKRLDMDPNGAAMEDTEEIRTSIANTVSSSQSGSKNCDFIERGVTCSKKQRAQCDSENHDVCSLYPKRDLDSCSTSSPEVVATDRKSGSSKFVEYWVPVRLSNVQLEQYCAALLSNSTLLRSCSKNDTVEALRDILISTRKCCEHPYLVDPVLQKLLTEGLAPVEYLDVGVDASGKLQVLDKSLSEIKKRGLRVLILFQSIIGSGRDSIGDYLDDFLRQRFGPDSYERVDCRLPTSKKQAALDMFNDKEKGRFVFLMETRACGPSIKLSSVDIVILYDSDWNPLNDLRALQKIIIDSHYEQLKVFRLFSSCTLEEKVLVLTKQEKTLDSSVKNINHSNIHLLLKWGASYLFKKLDEFHGSTPSSGSIVSAEESLLNVVQEFLTQIPQDSGNSTTNNCTILIKVKQTGMTYSRDISLPGELEMQLGDEDLPHVFWTKLLDKRSPKWRYLSTPSPRVRKKVQYFDKLPKEMEVDNDDVIKKQKKVVNDTHYPMSRKPLLEDERKVICMNKEGASATSVLNGSLPGSITMTDGIYYRSANDISYVTEAKIVESDGRRNLRDSQKNLHMFLKPKISELCEILRLPEDVKDAAGRYLEYVMNNHHVNKEPATILHAFQISLCWTAASSMKHRINRKETLGLAQQHLNFECTEKEAESVYLKLRMLKKLGSLAEKVMESNSGKDPARTTDGKHCLHGLAQSSVSYQQELEGEISESSNLEPVSAKQQATNSEKVSESPNDEISKSITQVKRIHSKRMKKIITKQMEEYQDFNKKKEKILDQSKAKLDNELKLESALIRHIHSKISVRLEKLRMVDLEFNRKVAELNNLMEMEQRKLEFMQQAARNEEKRMKFHWLREAKSGRPVASFSMIPLTESGFKMEDMDPSEKGRVSDAPEKATLISGPSSEQQPGEMAVAESPIIVKEAVEVAPVEHSQPVSDELQDKDVSSRELQNCSHRKVSSFQSSDHLSSQSVSAVIEHGGGNNEGGQNSSEQSQGPTQAPVQHQTELLNDLAAPQSVAQLEYDAQLRHTSSQQAELPIQHPVLPTTDALASTVTEHGGGNYVEGENSSEQSQGQKQPPVRHQAELYNLAPQPVTELDYDLQLRHTSSRQAEVATQLPVFPPAHALASTVMEHGGNNEVQNSSEQSQAPIQPRVEQAELVINITPQPVTRLEDDIQLRHASSQWAEVPTQPSPTEDHAELLSHSTVSDVMFQRPMSMDRPLGGSGTRLTDTRSMGVVPDSSNRPVQTAPVNSRMPQPPHLLHADPLSNELGRIHKEEDQLVKFHEDLKVRINSDFEKEIEEIQQKYNKLRQEADTAFVEKKKALEANFNKVFMNRMLAEVFRFKCSDTRAAGALGLQQGTRPEFMQQQFLQSSLQPNAQRPPVHASGAALAPPTAASPQIPVVHHYAVARPHFSSVGPSTTVNYQVGGSELRAPAPHLQPSMPSTSMSAAPNHPPPITNATIPSQQSLSNTSAASFGYLSGSFNRTNQSESGGVSRNTTPIFEMMMRDFDNGHGGANSPNHLLSPIPSFDPSDLFEPQIPITLWGPEACTGLPAADDVCLSDDN